MNKCTPIGETLGKPFALRAVPITHDRGATVTRRALAKMRQLRNENATRARDRWFIIST